MIRHADSHVDHGLTEAQIEYLLDRCAERTIAFTGSFEIPLALGTVPCGLYGPCMGDAPIADAECALVRRGGRSYTSCLVTRPMRQTNRVTVIAGPHDGHDCVLYTAFGGPCAPREVADPASDDASLAASIAFWREHALATGHEPVTATTITADDAAKVWVYAFEQRLDRLRQAAAAVQLTVLAQPRRGSVVDSAIAKLAVADFEIVCTACNMLRAKAGV